MCFAVLLFSVAVLLVSIPGCLFVAFQMLYLLSVACIVNGCTQHLISLFIYTHCYSDGLEDIYFSETLRVCMCVAAGYVNGVQ